MNLKRVVRVIYVLYFVPFSTKMPRNHVKKTNGPKYTQDNLQKAILEVENGCLIYFASKIHGVPEQSL